MRELIADAPAVAVDAAVRAAAVDIHAAAPAARGEDSFCIDKVHNVRSGGGRWIALVQGTDIENKAGSRCKLPLAIYL